MAAATVFTRFARVDTPTKTYATPLPTPTQNQLKQTQEMMATQAQEDPGDQDSTTRSLCSAAAVSRGGDRGDRWSYLGR